VAHPDEMKDHRIRRHPDTALSVRPSKELIAVVLKNSRFENTLLAVTDGAGHHAVVASNTRGEPIEEGGKVLHHPLEFLKYSISLLRPLGNHPVCNLRPRGGVASRKAENPFLSNFLFEFLSDLYSDLLIHRVTEELYYDICLGDRILAHLTGGSECISRRSHTVPL